MQEHELHYGSATSETTQIHDVHERSWRSGYQSMLLSKQGLTQLPYPLGFIAKEFVATTQLTMCPAIDNSYDLQHVSLFLML